MTNALISAYKFNKDFIGATDLYDLIEAYFPERHNTITRMRNIAYKALVETGIITETGVLSPEDYPPYKDTLKTCIPATFYSCSSAEIVAAVDKLRDDIDLMPPVTIIDEGVKADMFITGERISFPWFPYTETASHHELVGRFIQDLIKDIENDVNIVGKVKKRINEPIQ